MPMSSGKVDICNRALAHVGKAPITSIDFPSDPVEALLAVHYDDTRRALLRSKVWNFAKERAVLPRAGTPEFDYSDYYYLPNDCLRLLNVGGEHESRMNMDYDVSGRRILTNDGGGALKVRYIKDVTDVAMFDPLFVELLSLRLALNISSTLNPRSTMMDLINRLILSAEVEAAAIDGQERPPIKVNRSRATASRLSPSLGFSRDPRFPYA